MTSDNVVNLVLGNLCYIRWKVDHVGVDMTDLKRRISSLESTMILINHEVAHGDETDPRQQLSPVKIVACIQRI